MLTSALLLYNLDPIVGGALKALCGQLDLQWRDVPPEDQGRTLGEIVGLPAAPAAGAGAPFTEPMLVMANLTRPQFDRLLEGMRGRGIRIPLKAVLTPTNVGWNARQLHEELVREHEAMARQAKEP